MTTLIVTYTGAKDSRFDREYYRTHHLPLVRRTWGPHGLLTISALFPVDNEAAVGEDTGVIAACLCGFRDDDALREALASPNTPEVMNDLQNFTELTSVQNVLRSFNSGSETA